MKLKSQTSLIRNILPAMILFIMLLVSKQTSAQAEFTTWGNMTGIRVDNQLMEFSTSLAIVNKNDRTWRTRKEGQTIDFKRDGQEKQFSYEMRDIKWTNYIESTGKGEAEVEVSFSSPTDTLIKGAYFTVDLPEEFGTETEFRLISPDKIGLRDIRSNFSDAGYKAPAKGIVVESPTRKIEINFTEPTEVIIKTEDSLNPEIRLNFVLASGEVEAGKTYANTFTIKATGEIDTSPLNLKVYPDQEGDKFDGIGGNFRLQNPETDPQVIDYSLENLRVSWSRVEMPWREWHQNENEDPLEEARKGNLHPKVKAAMEMAQRLDKKGIPVILAAWFAPNWAIIGEPFKGKHPDGTMGNSLDLSKEETIYNSLTSYIKFLKEEYGVKTVMFSFNESDLGIDVRQTAEEHNQLIKELGKKFRSEGLETKFLLGDTADANGWDFTTLASTDPEAIPFIGGVSFHSWRGWTRENLIKWADISNRVNAPLFVGEGSIDAGAWRYPQIFEEPTYALDEIDVYLKILRTATPLTILQWQLTADYSPLSGGGIFGNDEDELYPTQRFYNLEQLGSTPKGLFAIPINKDKETVTAAAFGDKNKGIYAIHLVNKGATRNVKLTGLPENVKNLQIRLTNKENSYKNTKTIQVKNGEVNFQLQGASYVSLFSQN
ncbi:hypothetical protein RM549_04215 [Salegentibacter sp. F188]|uniref:Uncharacterized protein n=1 Tax=Autumnicola patrickiae TaxID=3075591 RepID=A0ABU3DZ89_9FLAO|nr:hypothetical protein [Salegentibacter sp. F188]MDT0688975.1 hypothetical protein [Salegentibacter sp. F188]